METIILTSKDDLRQLLQEVVQEQFAQVLRQVNLARIDPGEILLTRTEMAKFLRISLVTLRDWVGRGLPVHRKRKRGRILFIRSEVLEWLRQNADLRCDARQ